MDEIARVLLGKLLVAGNKSAAGVRSRKPALTAAQMTPYRELRSWHQKAACEATFFEARAAGAIGIVRDKHNPEDGLIERIDLLDVDALARFLGETPYSDLLTAANRQLERIKIAHPVIEEVVQKWARMNRVRGLGPENVESWLDAAQVIAFCSERSSQEAISAPIREVSARLFKDSKRIERLVAPVDVLVSDSTETPPRQPSEVWQEIGLFREEQPVLIAGHAVIERNRVTALLDAPYSGFPAASIRRVVSPVDAVMTIENLTTFHSEAKRRQDDRTLLIYTAGMPSPAWRAMYSRLLASIPASVSICHWGDIDEGGFRIAAVLAREALSAGHTLRPHAMSPGDVPLDMRIKASERTLKRIRHFASLAGWPELGDAIEQGGFTVEQEGLS